MNDRIFQKLDEAKLAKADLAEIIGIADAKKEILGTTEVCVNCGARELNLRCYVIKNFRYDVVLGLDMLDDILEGIDHRNGVITFKNGQNIERQKFIGAVECKATKDYTIKPHSMEIIEISTELPFAAECNVAGNSQWLKKGVVLQRNNKAVYGREPWESLVQNISEEQVKICKGQNLATAQWTNNMVASAWSTDNQPKQEAVADMVASAWSTGGLPKKECMAEKSSENRKASTKPQRQKDTTYLKTQSATKKKRKRIYRRTFRGSKEN